MLSLGPRPRALGKLLSSLRPVAARAFSSSGSGFSYPAPRTLDGLVNMDALRRESPEKIAEIWTQYHATLPTTAATTIDAPLYSRIASRATASPFFTLPVVRDTGYFTLLSQFQDRSWLLTYLEDYKKDPAAALPYLTVTVYPELARDTGLVLLRADVCAPATVGVADAARVLKQLEALYGDDDLHKMAYSFNNNTSAFDVQAAHDAMVAIQ